MRAIKLTLLEDIKEACALLDKFLGQGIHSADRYINNSNTTVYGIWNEKGQKLIGASTAKKVDWDDLNHINSYFMDTLDLNRTGFLESAALDEKYRSLGLGKEMVVRRLEFLMSIGCTDVVALCWLSGQERQSLPLLTKMGFTEVEHFNMPWQGENCPICGDDCMCNATLVHKKVQ